MVAGVVQIRPSRRALAARADAGAVPDLDVAGQCTAGEPGARVAGQLFAQPLPLGPPVGDLGQHPGPAPDHTGGRSVLGDQPVQLGDGEVDLDHPAADPAGRPGTAWAGPGWVAVAGSAAQRPGQQQIPVIVHDRVHPLRAPVLGRDHPAGDLGVHRAEAGDLPGPLIAPEQRAEADPDLHAFPDPDPFTAPPVPGTTWFWAGRAGRAESGGDDPSAVLVVGAGSRLGVALGFRRLPASAFRRVLTCLALTGQALVGRALVDRVLVGDVLLAGVSLAASSSAESSSAALSSALSSRGGVLGGVLGGQFPTG